jgi:hypothetical protein
MRPYRRQMLSLVLLLGVTALLAQLAGVGTTEKSRTTKTRSHTLATIPGSSVPDIGSTKLASGSLRAAEGETVRMRATARLHVRKLARGEFAQVVCGIRYSRDGDASWTLGYPTETIVLDHRGAREKVVVERSFNAPARDRYRASATCHVASPQSGAKVGAIGSLRLGRGLPAGAATPVE